MVTSWLQELNSKFSSSVSSCFILHGNTRDYVRNKEVYHKDPVALMELYLGDRNVLVRFDRVNGWVFPRKEHEPIVRDILRGAQPQAATQRDRYSGALQQSGIVETLPRDPATAFASMTALLKHTPQGANRVWDVGLIIDYAESILAADDWTGNAVDGLAVTALQWALDAGVRGGNTMILLVCRDDNAVLHPALNNPEARIESIYVPYPSLDERKHWLTQFFSRENAPPRIQRVKSDINQLAVSTAGLSYNLIEDCILRSILDASDDLESKEPILINPDVIKERKDSVIQQRYHDIIELAEPVHGYEAIGGLDEIKELFHTDIAVPMKSGNRNRVPQGVLLMGPPGTGKSVLAEALACDAGVLFLLLRFSKIYSKYIGESEKRLDKVLNASERMAPCIIFIDEIDQAGHRRDTVQGDSGVNARIFQRLLEKMADTNNRGRIVWLAATNRPDLLDPAMKRAGRFDVRVPFFAPEGKERVAIVGAICRKNNITLKGTVSDDFIEATDGYVGADIEMVVLKARNLVEDRTKKSDIVTAEALSEIVKVIKPSLKADVISVMEKMAFEECNDTRLLPKRFRGGIRAVGGRSKVTPVA